MSEEKVEGVGGMADRSVEETEALLKQIVEETEAKMLDLGKRAVGLEKWCWVVGMRTIGKEVVCSVAQNGILRLYADKKLVERDATDCVPNFADPMTVLGLVDVIRIAFPERDFVVQFPAMIPMHELAYSLVDYLEDTPKQPHTEAE